MIDWEEIIKAESVEELKAAKLWLFRENMRLQNEQKELAASKDKFLKDRIMLRNELDELNHRIAQERKRLKEENLFFDKKMEILKDGFRKLEEDRKLLEREKRYLAEEKRTSQARGYSALDESAVTALFRNANNPLTLRKRYRDLVKIFHPDNLAGDAELMQTINREFMRKRDEM